MTQKPEVNFGFNMGDKEWSLETLKQIQTDLADDPNIKAYEVVK